MGHYGNDTLRMYSARPENCKIYEKEVGKINRYAQENAREYFAKSFRLYITEPELLKLLSSPG